MSDGVRHALGAELELTRGPAVAGSVREALGSELGRTRASAAADGAYERGSIFNNFSAHADGERRGLDRIGGQRRKGLGEAHL